MPRKSKPVRYYQVSLDNNRKVTGTLMSDKSIIWDFESRHLETGETKTTTIRLTAEAQSAVSAMSVLLYSGR